MNWEDDDLASQIAYFMHYKDSHTFHLMTDAAGSVTNDDAKSSRLHASEQLSDYRRKVPAGNFFHPEELYSRDEKGSEGIHISGFRL